MSEKGSISERLGKSIRERLGNYGSSAWLKGAMEEQDPVQLVRDAQRHFVNVVEDYLIDADELIAKYAISERFVTREFSRDIGRMGYMLYLVSHPHSPERGLACLLRYLEARRW